MLPNVTENLEKKHCIPCEGKVAPIAGSDVERLLSKVPGWSLEGLKIGRDFKFKDFVSAMEFVNRVAEIAESEQHHPDFQIHYNLVKVTVWTHAANGLTENDFILAAKINTIKV